VPVVIPSGRVAGSYNLSSLKHDLQAIVEMLR
jgi:hypothetical protein